LEEVDEMKKDSSDTCEYGGGSTPEAQAACVKYLEQRSSETAEERWERYQRTDSEKRAWTTERLARLLNLVSKPCKREDVPVEFDPDVLF
jgi:hypothetical protein